MAVQASSNTNSTLLGPDGLNKTSTAISTNIIIMANNQPVGAIQEFSVDESRTVAMIDEVGTDGHIDSVPTKSTEITGSCRRIRFDRMKAFEAFGRGITHVASQRIPFDIVIIDNWNGNGTEAVITTIKNVWFTKIGYSFKKDDWTITDDVNWTAETIYTTLANGNNAATAGGEINRSIKVDSIEAVTDVGGKRGSLDSGALLKAMGV